MKRALNLVEYLQWTYGGVQVTVYEWFIDTRPPGGYILPRLRYSLYFLDFFLNRDINERTTDAQSTFQISNPFINF